MQHGGIGQGNAFNIKIHQNKARGIPNLIAEIAGGFDFFIGEAHVIPGGITCCKGKAQRVGAVFVDNLQRVDSVSEGF